jgi:hypothetical protein
MGRCRDKATTYLASHGYNVIRHPASDIKPLELIGIQKGTTERLGEIDDLINNPNATLPKPDEDIPAADLQTVSSSKLNIKIGAEILGAFVGAMNGTLGVSTGYTNATRIQFEFTDVTKDRIRPSLVGQFMKGGELDEAHPTFKPYVVGQGQLYVITETVKSQSFSVQYERGNNVGAAVDLPLLQDLLGAEIQVSTQRDKKYVISYRGQAAVVFGFRCFELGVLDGDLVMFSSQPGAVALSNVLGPDGLPVEDDHAALLTDPEYPLLVFG